jgi:hypothetical protein
MRKRFPDLYYNLLLGLICLTAYWQIAFHVHPVKYDMPDCYYPWRSFISDALKNGYAPVWNPYQLFGSPIHADPSSGAWYPPVWAIGLLFGYSLKIVGWELLLHIWLAGVGFLKLGKRLGFSMHISFLLSIGYMLSGIFVGNAQHLTYVVSACWIPFILFYFLNALRLFSLTDAVKGGIALFLLLTGGYPAFSIILFYLLLILSLGHLFQLILKKNIVEISRWAGVQGVFAGTALLLSGGFLWAVYNVMPLITRTRSFTAVNAQYGPFSPEALSSFILPYASVDAHFVKTDISMANGYFGFIFFILFLISLFYRTTPLIRIFQFFSFFSLSASLGASLPVREWLFDFVPGMNLFRFPGVFRLFIILGFLSSAGIIVEKIQHAELSSLRITKFSFGIAFILLLITGLFLVLLESALFPHAWFTRTENPQATHHAGLQALIMAVVALAVTLVCLFERTKKRLFLFLCLIISAEMILSVQLNAPYTVFYKEFTGGEVQTTEKLFTPGFPVPDVNKPMNQTATHLIREPFWKNLDIFNKQPSAAGMNNFMFASTMYMLDEEKEGMELLAQNPVAYLGGEIKNPMQFHPLKKEGLLHAKMLFIQNVTPEKFPSEGLLEITELSPENWLFQADVKEKTTLTLLQNYSTAWNVEIDGKNTDYVCSNGSFITVFLPEGRSEIRFSYQKNKVKYAYIISILLFIPILCLAYSPEIIRIFRKETAKK